ncbi:NAD-dependent epimerase/dehydratase family protein [Kordia sp. YSTF-M3]|uniref:NAD-dependent epimerase/dehydratase family protein n=1 Tax=Kordia aestuariivivens TaxID=2759037 RepID=A0ABR7QFP4_9FLAO|nr:NAD-dependent epimerase/dehydratase family protein [Kordia aestuariivivens]MBC8757323.1 NAD-dependent epimerase/dehydratase family protein [Kordia aestuariivivens]
MTTKILIIGACGQIGTELTAALRTMYGIANVVASDIRKSESNVFSEGIFEVLDARDKEAIAACVDKHTITDVYLMAALLSATAEKNPELAWDLNMNSLLHVLNLAKDQRIKKVFWPSSIAVFGHNSPKKNTPQHTIMEPSTVYGISKLSGERWCEYYHKNYGVDVRSIRYPGIISWKANPGGGTTDYAVEIFHEAIKHGTYTCFLNEDTSLPMMFMDDAVRATIDIMNAEASNVKVRSSYNIAATSFTPKELTIAIQELLPDFTIRYEPDFRQEIADSWPESIDDTTATNDWNWSSQFDMKAIVSEMITNLKKVLG